MVEIAISGLGANGTDGSSGSSGSSGRNGTSGTSGQTGATGTSGTSGQSGASGTSGTSGSSISVSGTANRVVKFATSTTIGNSNASDDGTTFQIDTSKLKVTTSIAVGNITPSGVTGRLDAANDVVAFSTSDERLKTNFVQLENALEKVKSITGYEFDWVEDLKSHHGFEGHDVGVKAQDVQKVLPEIVTTKFNGYLGVKYEKIVPLLIEAIKDLSNQIEELKRNKTGT